LAALLVNGICLPDAFFLEMFGGILWGIVAADGGTQLLEPA
jgi:hypothetical protein